MGSVSAQSRVALVNLGCRVNRVELDMMALALEQAGCVLGSQREAAVVIVNTCAVTGEAQAKTRKAIRHAANLPQHPWVVATGCVASLFAPELKALGSNVVVEPNKAQVASRALELLGADMPETGQDTKPIEALPHNHAFATPTGRTRPGIKIQDGCDNHCTFCIVWKARGHSRSVELEQVLREVRAAQQRGAQEIVLTGINLGNYRANRPDGTELALPGLIDEILTQTDVGRVRLSSIEPPDVTDELLDVMASADSRVARFLHVCLQSGCDRTLHQMGRVYNTSLFAHTADRARQKMPNISLGTDLIVGFPGETDQDFEESLAFCKSMSFSRMHVFRYSRRPGTPAAARTDQIAPTTIAARSAQALELAQEMRAYEAEKLVGKRELVVVQDRGRAVSGGLFDVLVDDSCAQNSLIEVQIARMLSDTTLDGRT